jgi:hypothetical protein
LATLTLVAQVRAEPNNLLYFLHEDLEAPGHFVFYEIFARQPDFELAGSIERLPQTSNRGRLDRGQHAMACDRVVERRAEMRSLAIVAGQAHVRLGDIRGKVRPLLR